jgi:long-chain fatty acid transport protein
LKTPLGKGQTGEAMQRGFKQRGHKFVGAAAIGFLALTSLAPGEARATEGYFQYGYGARQGGLAGAGVADSRDAMSLALNPAGLVDAGYQFQGGISLFVPHRGYEATGPFFVAPGAGGSGTIDSSNNYFGIPNLAYSKPIDADSAWGVAMFGNGGMNTTYENVKNGTCAYLPFPNPGNGVFCGGDAGVDMMQAFITAGYARRMGAFSFGVAPVIAIQRFKISGVGAFSPVSSDPNNLTNKGYDWSYGFGVRVGMQWKVAPNFRLGLSAQTPTWMTKFHKYSGLFAEQGGFDIPTNFTVGAAWDMTPAATLMVDYKRIFYSTIASVGNPSWMPGPQYSCDPSFCFGANGGAGFGWHDVDVFKVGVEWRASPAWTLRAGYAHNTNPIKSPDVTLNILAPGVVTDHFTGGFSYKMSPNWTLDFAGAYVPRHSVSGTETLPQGFGGTLNPASNIELHMSQYQLTAQLTYQFDTAVAPKPPLIHK